MRSVASRPILTVLLGFVGQYIRDLWTGETVGGGPIESTIRIVTQENMVVPLDLGTVPMRIIQWSDYILITLMHALASLLPNFSKDVLGGGEPVDTVGNTWLSLPWSPIDSTGVLFTSCRRIWLLLFQRQYWPIDRGCWRLLLFAVLIYRNRLV